MKISALNSNWVRTIARKRVVALRALVGMFALATLLVQATAQTYPGYTPTTPQDRPYAQPVKTVLADFNNDGIADLATVGYQNGSSNSYMYLEVYLGKGDGTFSSGPDASSTVDQCARIVGLAAFGRDDSGSLNLALTCYDTLQVWHVIHSAAYPRPVYVFNDPSTRQVITLDTGAAAMAVGDFTGAGNPGVAVLEYGPQRQALSIAVYSPGTCSANCSGSSTFLPLNTQPLMIDATNDVGSSNDVGRVITAIRIPPFTYPAIALATAVIGPCGGTLVSYLYNPSGTNFKPGDSNPMPADYCVNAMASGDLDNDGYDDLVLGGVIQGTAINGFLSVSMGSSDGVLSAPGSSLFHNAPISIASDGMAIVDLNADGNADLIVGVPQPQGQSGRADTVNTYFGNGDGTFGNLAMPGVDVSGASAIGLGTGVQSVAVGNMNLDGYPDILMVDLIGNGSGGGVGDITPKPGSLVQTAGSRTDSTTTTLTSQVQLGFGGGPGGGGGAVPHPGVKARKRAPANAYFGSNSFTLVATVSSAGNALSDGWVQFFDATTQSYIGSAEILDGSAVLTVDLAGTHYFTACFGGFQSYAGSCSDVYTGAPSKKDPYVSLDVEPTNAVPGQTITFNASVYGNGSTPTGTITFVDNNTGMTLATAPLDGNGNASATTTSLPVGQYDVIATYSGDANYNAATSVDNPLSIAIPLVPVSITLTSSASAANYLATVTLTANVIAQDGSTPTGSILFQAAGVTLATVPITGTTMTVDVTPPVGSYSLQVVYTGQPGYAAAVSNTLPLTIHGGLLQFVADAAYTVAGIPGSDNRRSSSIGDGGPATQAGLYSPYGITTDGAGNIYFADEQNNIVRKITTDGIIHTVAGTQYIGNYYTTRFGGDGGPATNALLSNPSGVVSDRAGTLYIADYSNNVVRRVDAVTGIITTYAGVPGQSGYSTASGVATQVYLSHPVGLALDSAGNLYIADSGNNVIRKVDASGNISIVAGYYYRDSSTPPAQQTSLSRPMGVAVDKSGNVYVSDSGNGIVYRVDTLGNIFPFAGSANPYGAGNDGGPATAAAISSPEALAIDLAGNVFIVDNGHNSIRKVDPFGTITTVAGLTGSSGSNYYFYDPQGAPATEMTLVSPSGVAIDASGSLLLTDTYNQTVMRVGPQGTVQFGPQAAGTTSNPQYITLYNAGDLGISYGATPLTVTGDYNVAPGGTSPCNFNQTLAPGASCTLAITSQPAGNGLTGLVSISSTASGNPTIALKTNTTVLSSAVTVYTNGPNVYLGDAVQILAQVNGLSSGPPPTGTMSFYDGTTLLGTQTVNQTYGSAELDPTGLSVGSHTFTVVYSGDAYYATSTSEPATITVQPYQTMVSLAVDNSTPAYGQAATFTATITAVTAANPIPGGSVAFYDGSTLVGTATLTSGTNSVTLTTSSLAVGSHIITAVYSGSGSYGGSTSAGLTVAVSAATGGGGGGGGTPTGFNYVINSFGIPTQLHRGDSSQGLGVTVISYGNAGGTLALACGTLPRYATCSFAPATVNAAAGASTSVAWTITTTPSP